MAIREEKKEELVVVGVKSIMSCDKCGKECEVERAFIYLCHGWCGIRAPGVAPEPRNDLHFCPECYPRIYAVITGAL